MFPLALTPFEYYYWCDDRPQYPTAYAFELTFQGPLVRAALESALAAALARHPLLSARVQPARRGAVWIAGDSTPPPIDWAQGGVPVRHPDGPRIDLSRAGGLRIWVRCDSERSVLRLQFHHACGDGLGALRFIEDLLVAYHQLVHHPGSEPQLPPLAVERLPQRGVFRDPAEVAAESWTKKVRDAWITAGHWLPMLLAPAAPLAVPAGAQGEEDVPVLGFATEVLGEPQVETLRQAARRRGATLNDLLLAAMFRTLALWNARHGGGGTRLRINVPVSLRTPRDQWLPMANRLSFAFLTRDSAACRDEASLLPSIAAEVRRIREQRIGLYFLGGLEFGAQLPGVVRHGLFRPHCFATIVLSNLGRVLHRAPLPRDDASRLVCGGATLLRVTGAPPVRPLTRAAVAILQYAGETTVNLRVDPTCLSRREASELLAAYAAGLETEYERYAP